MVASFQETQSKRNNKRGLPDHLWVLQRALEGLSGRTVRSKGAQGRIMHQRPENRGALNKLKGHRGGKQMPFRAMWIHIGLVATAQRGPLSIQRQDWLGRSHSMAAAPAGCCWPRHPATGACVVNGRLLFCSLHSVSMVLDPLSACRAVSQHHRANVSWLLSLPILGFSLGLRLPRGCCARSSPQSVNRRTQRPSKGPSHIARLMGDTPL